MKHEDFTEKVIDQISSADTGEYEVFSEQDIDDLFGGDDFPGLFSSRKTLFGMFADPAPLGDSTGLILANRIGSYSSESSKETKYYIQGAKRLPPLFIENLRKLVLNGGQFLSQFTKYRVPVHVVIDTTRNSPEIIRLKNILKDRKEDRRENLKKHMISQSENSKHNHLVGNEGIKAYGIKFGSSFSGNFEEWKSTQISKEYMVLATIRMIESNSLKMDPDIAGAEELIDQLRDFGARVKESRRGKTVSFKSKNDDLVDSLLMMGYWSHLQKLRYGDDFHDYFETDSPNDQKIDIPY